MFSLYFQGMTGEGDEKLLECTQEGENLRNPRLDAKATQFIPIVQTAYDLLKEAKTIVVLNAYSKKLAAFQADKDVKFGNFFDSRVMKRVSSFVGDLKNEYSSTNVKCPTNVEQFHTVMGTGFQSFEWVTKHAIDTLMREWYAGQLAYTISIIIPNEINIPELPPIKHTYSVKAVDHKLQYKHFCENAVKPIGENIDALVEKAKGIIDGTKKLGSPLRTKLGQILDQKKATANSNVSDICSKEIDHLKDTGALDSQNKMRETFRKRCREYDASKRNADAAALSADIRTVSAHNIIIVLYFLGLTRPAHFTSFFYLFMLNILYLNLHLFFSSNF